MSRDDTSIRGKFGAIVFLNAEPLRARPNPRPHGTRPSSRELGARRYSRGSRAAGSARATQRSEIFIFLNSILIIFLMGCSIEVHGTIGDHVPDRYGVSKIKI